MCSVFVQDQDVHVIACWKHEFYDAARRYGAARRNYMQLHEHPQDHGLPRSPVLFCDAFLVNSGIPHTDISLISAVSSQQGVDAEERVKELEDALDFSWQCEADTRRLAAADAALAQANIHALTQRLASAGQVRAVQVLLCVNNKQ